MVRGQKASINGIELFLCPFENLYITQGPDEAPSHKGIMAWDVSGTPQESYFAPATSICKKIYYDSGQSMWQTTGNVRCPNGYVGIVTYMIVHDNDISDLWIGKIVNQGDRLGEFGTKGNVTGSHCHIEFSQGSDTSWFKNQYDNYMFSNEKDPEEVCFMDNTNILNGFGDWKYTSSLYIGEPIKRDTTKDQIRVFTNKYYPTGRKSPMGYISGFVKEGIYNVLDVKNENNLTWYKIANDLWFDFGKDWSEVLFKDEADDADVINKMKEEILELQKQIDKLTKENQQLKNDIKEKDEILNEYPIIQFTSNKKDFYTIKSDEKDNLYLDRTL